MNKETEDKIIDAFKEIRKEVDNNPEAFEILIKKFNNEDYLKVINVVLASKITS